MCVGVCTLLCKYIHEISFCLSGEVVARGDLILRCADMSEKIGIKKEYRRQFRGTQNINVKYIGGSQKVNSDKQVVTLHNSTTIVLRHN